MAPDSIYMVTHPLVLPVTLTPRQAHRSIVHQGFPKKDEQNPYMKRFNVPSIQWPPDFCHPEDETFGNAKLNATVTKPSKTTNPYLHLFAFSGTSTFKFMSLN